MPRGKYIISRTFFQAPIQIEVVDDVNIRENATKDLSFHAAGQHGLLERTEAAIVELEACKSRNPACMAMKGRATAGINSP